MDYIRLEQDIQDRTKRYFGVLYSKLQQSSVLIVGAGAVGTEVIKNLVMMGIQTIYLVDFDKVSLSNLNRCVFFQPQDHNQAYKVNVIAERIQKIWQGTKIFPYPVSIQEAPEEVWQVPIVIIAVDNNEARYYCNMRTLSQENPPFIINGAMGRTFFEVQVLLPRETSCMACSWSQEYMDRMFKKIVRQTCDQFFTETIEQFPAISVINSMIGAIMANETVKILVGLERWKLEKKWDDEHIPILGKSLRYDISTHEFSVGKLTPNPSCVEIFCREHQKK